MNDHARRTLEDLPAPDLWPRIEQGLDGAPPRRGRRAGGPTAPSGRQRLLAAVVAFAVVGAGIAVAWNAFRPKTRPVSSASVRPTGRQLPVPSAAPITVAAMFKGADARCEATLTTPVVRPGQIPQIVFRLTNEGSTALLYGTYFDFVSVRDGSGKEVASWLDRFGGGVVPSIPAPSASRPLAPGRIVRTDRSDEPTIRWPGPLSLRLTCPFVIGHRTGNEMHMSASPKLPALPLRVFAPGPAPSAEFAVGRAIGASGGLFHACRPTPNGSSVVGRIDPPRLPGQPDLIPAPLRARCWATVGRLQGFDVVTLWFVSPPQLPLDDYVTLPNLPTVEVVKWVFVVTRTTVGSALGPVGHGKSASATVDYTFANGRWSSGDRSCGPDEYFASSSVTFPVPKNPC